jgi:hypothetical protein
VNDREVVIKVMIIIGREKEGKEEVKKERTDLLPIYIFEKRSKRNALFQLRFDPFIHSHHR